MKILVILAHPNNESFNHAIAKTVVSTLYNNSHEVIFHDLYAEKFNPILPFKEFLPESELDNIIKIHCEEIVSADGIIIIHPNWWGQPPAILKGWIDRVLRPKIVYEFLEGDPGEGVPIGLLKIKDAIVFNTSNTFEKRELNHFGDPLETLWKTCIFDLIGIDNFHRKTFSVIITSSLAKRKKWLNEVKKTINEKFPGIL